MKKLMFVCLALVMGMGMIVAAPKTAPKGKQVVTTVFATDIECEHCAKKITDNVASLGKGIEDVKVDVASKQVTVKYDATKNNDANIIKGLASLKVKASVKGGKTVAPKAKAKSCTGDCESCGKCEGI